MARDDDQSSGLFLVQAAFDGDLEGVKRFVTEGNVNKSVSIYGHFATPLSGACRTGHIEIVRVLLGFGADVGMKSNDSTPLHIACDEGHLGIVRLLLARGANIEDTDWYGRTALQRACDSGHNEVVATLLEHGADVSTVDEEKWTPLHISRSGRVARILLENGADVNARDRHGFTPLARMSLCDDEDRVSTLLDYGAGTGIICGLQHSQFEPNCTKTVLMCCYNSCHEEIFRKWLPCFEKYFIKSKLAGVRVEEMEKPVDPPEVGVDWNQSERDAFAEQCLRELQALKTDTISDTTATYFALLTRELSSLRGQNILGKINWEDCHRRYPIYGTMIRCSYQTLRRFFLKDLSLELFPLIHDSMLTECAEMILDYLPDKDLETIASMVSRLSIVRES